MGGEGVIREKNTLTHGKIYIFVYIHTYMQAYMLICIYICMYICRESVQ